MHRCNETAISLKASCQLFLRYTTRTNDLDEPIDASKARLIEVGSCFVACMNDQDPLPRANRARLMEALHAFSHAVHLKLHLALCLRSLPIGRDLQAV